MQIVIDIPKEKYDMVRNKTYCGIYDRVIYKAIAKCTPLPKGHGRLIIEPTKEEIEKTVGGLSDFAEYGRECVKAVLDNAPTIVEADKEKKDADSD